MIKLNEDEGNPNLISIRVAGISLLQRGSVHSLGRILYLDLGYEVMSFFLDNGPVIVIKYRELQRVNFSENGEVAEVIFMQNKLIVVE